MPPGYSDPTSKGSSFWTTGRKLGAVVTTLIAIAVAMAILSFFYWRATRPGDRTGSGSTGTGPGADTDGPTGPVGPLDAMVVDALRPDPFVTRDDLGLT